MITEKSQKDSENTEQETDTVGNLQRSDIKQSSPNDDNVTEATRKPRDLQLREADPSKHKDGDKDQTIEESHEDSNVELVQVLVYTDKPIKSDAVKKVKETVKGEMERDQEGNELLPENREEDENDDTIDKLEDDLVNADMDM